MKKTHYRPVGYMGFGPCPKTGREDSFVSSEWTKVTCARCLAAAPVSDEQWEETKRMAREAYRASKVAR